MLNILILVALAVIGTALILILFALNEIGKDVEEVKELIEEQSCEGGRF